MGALARADAAAAPSASAPSPTAEYQRALTLATQAYIYGYPLLDTDRVFKTATSTNVPNGAGGGPVNQFSHIRRLASPADRTVVAPNHDTLYSMAWLDLRREPIVIHMPVVRGRFTVMELLDPYTENFASIGSVGHPPGDYAVVAPGWHGRLPHGVKVLRSPYPRVWIIGRTYIRDAADTVNVVRIQNQYSLTPLDRWGTRYLPARPRHAVRTSKQFTVPGTQAGENPLAFFDALGDQLRRFPPSARDRPLLGQLATIGVGPGLHPSTNAKLDAAVRQALHDGVANGAAQVTTDIRTAFVSIAPKHNGWLVSRTGTYGTDYATRAVVDAIGLGAPVSSLAIYPFTITDLNFHPLTGASRYWQARHPNIGADVSSYMLTGSGTALDPLLPEGDEVSSLGPRIERVVLTCRHHTRSAADFGVPILVHRSGLHEFEGTDVDVVGYDAGDVLLPGVQVLPFGRICPDDAVLKIDLGPGVLAFGDGLLNYLGLGHPPDQYIGDDPEAIKADIVEGLVPSLDEDLDVLLFAHGTPVPSGGKELCGGSSSLGA